MYYIYTRVYAYTYTYTPFKKVKKKKEQCHYSIWTEYNSTKKFYLTLWGHPQSAQMTTLVPLRELLSWRNTLTSEACSTHTHTSDPLYRQPLQQHFVCIDDCVCLNRTARVCSKETLLKACGCRSDVFESKGCAQPWGVCMYTPRCSPLCVCVVLCVFEKSCLCLCSRLCSLVCLLACACV